MSAKAKALTGLNPIREWDLNGPTAGGAVFDFKGRRGLSRVKYLYDIDIATVGAGARFIKVSSGSIGARIRLSTLWRVGSRS